MAIGRRGRGEELKERPLSARSSRRKGIRLLIGETAISTELHVWPCGWQRISKEITWDFGIFRSRRTVRFRGMCCAVLPFVENLLDRIGRVVDSLTEQRPQILVPRFGLASSVAVFRRWKAFGSRGHADRR